MFKFFRRRKIDQVEELPDRYIFIDHVHDICELPSGTGRKIPIENLVMIYAMHVAGLTIDCAKGKKKHPEEVANAVEKAAMIIIFTQAAHMGREMVKLKDNDAFEAIVDTGMARLLETDLHQPSPQALAEISLASQTFKRLADENLELLRRVNDAAEAYVRRFEKERIDDLAKCWNEIVRMLNA